MLQLGSRGGNRYWAQCHTRQMNDFEQWINNDIQESAYHFLNKDPNDRGQCAVSDEIIHSDTSRREGPLLLPPIKDNSPAHNLSSIHSAIESLTATVHGLINPDESESPRTGLHVKTQIN